MHLRQTIGCLILTLVLTGSVLAGPPLACHQFMSTRGSAFEALEELRRYAMSLDDSPSRRESGLRRLAELRRAMNAEDALSVLKAGYWTELMNQLRLSSEKDGVTLILKALSMRPYDPEYHFIAALAQFQKDDAAFRKHWEAARKLSKPGSATAANLKAFGDVLLTD
jgi:hypothetical protein